MSDTLQIVKWHLSFACPFRQGDAMTSSAAAQAATSGLRLINSVTEQNDVYGDLCVAGVAYSQRGKDPASVHRISDLIAPVADLSAARSICGNCPANALDAAAGQLAGCCGYLPFDSDDPRLEPELRDSIATRGLARDVARAFPDTKRVWYSFWIASPLDREQALLLAGILPAVSVGSGRLQVEQFRQACRLKAEHDLSLHVSLSPRGHVDMGWRTTFPHCPRCKFGSGERWEENYRDQPLTCAMCGHVYVPASTASMERYGAETTAGAETDPEKLLSPRQYRRLRREWLRRHADDARTLVDELVGGDENPDQQLLRELVMRHERPSLVSRVRQWVARWRGR